MDELLEPFARAAYYAKRKKTDSQKSWEDITENQRDIYRNIAKAVLQRQTRSDLDYLKTRLKIDKETGKGNTSTLGEIIMALCMRTERYLRGHVELLVSQRKIEKMPLEKNQNIKHLQDILLGVKDHKYINAEDPKRHRPIRKSIERLHEIRNDTAHGRTLNVSHDETEKLIDDVFDMISIRLNATFTTGPATAKANIQVTKKVEDTRA